MLKKNDSRSGFLCIDGNVFKKMLIYGANELTKNCRAVDALNVFPVPDGDTGTNMSHTVQAAAREVERLNTPNLYDMAQAAKNGALRGARGNSGVILSQLFRGFAKGLENKSTADVTDLADAFKKASETAYKAVMKPKEGTMLTIARVMAECAQDGAFGGDDMDSALETIISYGYEWLEKTTAMLPELRQANVVDAGGMGLLLILKGARAGLTASDEPVRIETVSAEENEPISIISEADIKFAYCTEVLLESDPGKKRDSSPEEALKTFLAGLGDSIVVITDDNITKIHIHTNHPGLVLEKALHYGILSNIKIDNMRMQHNNALQYSTQAKPQKEIGFVAVAAGQGLCALFTDLGADEVIEGGQTMNPSAEDIAKAAANVNAKNIIVLPNNKNIKMAAEQAAYLLPDGKQIFVMPTKSIPQGISCLINYMDGGSVEDNLGAMKEAIEFVHCGQVTFAVRDTSLNDKKINEGDIICLYDGDLALVAKDVQSAARALADHMLSFGGDLVSIYHGDQADIGMANEISDYINEKYPHCEIEIFDGKQPLYYYIISVE